MPIIAVVDVETFGAGDIGAAEVLISQHPPFSVTIQLTNIEQWTNLIGAN